MKTNKFQDPYEQMSDSEFSGYVGDLFKASRRQPSIPVSLRMPEELLTRIRRIATRGHVPYQRLIKQFIEAGTAKAEKELTISKPRPKSKTQAPKRVLTKRS